MSLYRVKYTHRADRDLEKLPQRKRQIAGEHNHLPVGQIEGPGNAEDQGKP